MSYPITTIANIIAANASLPHPTSVVKDILTDSRKVLIPEHSLFFALPGQNRQGNYFIKEMVDKGVHNFVLDNNYTPPAYLKNCNCLFVPNVLTALQQLAAYHRQQYQLPIIGITGSNGKTIVKEWLYQLLSSSENVVRSPHSYNSQIGVPLSIWLIDSQHSLGIFESGISLPNEMLPLQQIIQPQIGIITFIGSAHAEGFTGIEEKIREKLLLFSQSKLLIYGLDDEVLHNEVLQFIALKNPTLATFTWGKTGKATLQVTNTIIGTTHTSILLQYNQITYHYSIPFTDQASIHNTITCLACLLALGKPIEATLSKMPSLKAIEMRMEMKKGINNTLIINDGYSADEQSLSISLQFLQQQRQYKKHSLILSDILQSGKHDADLYSNIAAILAKQALHTLIAIGPKLCAYAHFFRDITHTYFYASTTDFLQQIDTPHFKEEVILLKGARIFSFEKIGAALAEKSHETRLEINLTALRHNLKLYRNLLLPTTKIMVMVKAFGYGSGSAEVANILQQEGVNYLAVAYVDEGVSLRQAGITLPIMVLNTEVASFDNLIKYNLEPEIYSFKIVENFISFLKQKEITNYSIHLKIDTGMKRLGFEEKELVQLCQILTSHTCLHVASIFSHLAGSDVANFDEFTSLQYTSFVRIAQHIEQVLGYTCVKHIANSAAIYRHPHLQLNMVRLGIGLYGVDASAGVQQQLKQVSTLKTTIAQIKQLQAGETIGYSRKGRATQPTTTATVRIGYADGYPRVMSNGKGYMNVNGQLAPVIGNVCMDMTMLNITGIPAVEGDEVIVFGQLPTVKDVATYADTIAYEILTNISQRVKRVYFEE